MRKVRLSPWTSVFLGNHNLSPKTRALWDRWTDRFPSCLPEAVLTLLDWAGSQMTQPPPSTCAPCVQMEIHVTRPVSLSHFNVFKSFLFYRGQWKGWKAPRREEVGDTRQSHSPAPGALCRGVCHGLQDWLGWPFMCPCKPFSSISDSFFFTLLSTFLVQYMYHKEIPRWC